MLFKELRFRFEIIEVPHSVCCVLKTCFITSDIIYNSRFRTEIDTNIRKLRFCLVHSFARYQSKKKADPMSHTYPSLFYTNFSHMQSHPHPDTRLMYTET